MRWLWVHLSQEMGLSNESSRSYAFWSGIGGDLPLLAGFSVFYRKHTCHSRGCWRLGHHPIANSPFVVCAKHHPDITPLEAP